MRQILRVIALVAALFDITAFAQVGQAPNIAQLVPASGFTPSCSQSSTFLTAATGVTLTADKTNYDTLICGLVSDGVWNFDVLYIWAAPTQATAQINLANPGTYNGTLNGTTAGTFTAYQGFTGNAAGAADFYIDSGFNPSTAPSPNYVQNSATAGVYILSNRTVSQNWWAIGNNPGLTSRSFESGSGNGRINNNASGLNFNTSTAQGALNLTRVDAINPGSFLNSGETATGSTIDTSDTVTNGNVLFFTLVNGFGHTGDQIAAGWVGKGVGSGAVPGSGVDSCKINNRINTYMATLSVPQNVYSNSAC